jgi:hypothetical protein
MKPSDARPTNPVAGNPVATDFLCTIREVW